MISMLNALTILMSCIAFGFSVATICVSRRTRRTIERTAALNAKTAALRRGRP